MPKQEVFLNVYDLMFTHGFITMMIVIWGFALFIGVPIVYILNKSAYKGKH